MIMWIGKLASLTAPVAAPFELMWEQVREQPASPARRNRIDALSDHLLADIGLPPP
jgi:hypothetical protein